MLLINSRCWCSRSDVEIPVAWVREGKTAPCAYPGCGPGCVMVELDDDDDPVYEQPTRKRIRMNKQNPDKYDPRSDSTPGLAMRSDAIVIAGGPGLCPCGCGEAPKGAKATFGMGHDIRLRGKLARASAANKRVVIVDTDGGYVEDEYDPIEFAARFSTASMDWSKAVRSSADKVLARRRGSAAEREVLAHATGPQPGDRKVIRVGRWDYTGKIAAVYDDGGRIVYEYVSKSGEVRRAEQGEDGKVRVVA